MLITDTEIWCADFFPLKFIAGNDILIVILIKIIELLKKLCSIKLNLPNYGMPGNSVSLARATAARPGCAAGTPDADCISRTKTSARVR